MRLVVLASACVAFVGCRQILGIEEAQLPQPVGHDEDGDNVDDGIDNCPADSNPSQASTEPGIGTVCDPRPTERGDSLAMFFSFYPSGKPESIAPTTAIFEGDVATLANTSIETTDEYMPTVVAATMAFGTFVGDAAVELYAGGVLCRITSCNGRICLVVEAADATDTVNFTPTTFDVTLGLVQTDDVYACTLAAQSASVQITKTADIAGPVGVRTIDGTMFVKNLTVYE